MARITTITLNQSEGGAASIISGQLSGAKNRQVEVRATPVNGWAFDKWEITTSELSPLPVFVTAVERYANPQEVCANSTSIPSVGFVLYFDNTALYLDPEGNSVALTGYYDIGNGNYYIWDGVNVPSRSDVQTCRTSGGGGTGGGGGDGTGGGGGGGGGFGIDDDFSI
jgi:hypothetical protein